MDHFKHIYANRAAEYHQMIAPEDVDEQLLPALERAAGGPLAGRRVLDLGSGTGRIPLMLRSVGAQIMALDLSRAMLREQQRQRALTGGRWQLVQGDVRKLPFGAGVAEVVTAGWAIGHLVGWHPEDWREHIDAAVAEMLRAVTPGGSVVIFETMSTGSLTPAPPSPDLAAYYARLENQWGFTREDIRTDYQFDSIEQAVAYTEFFFGPDLSALIRANRWARLPEWTGVWGRGV